MAPATYQPAQYPEHLGEIAIFALGISPVTYWSARFSNSSILQAGKFLTEE